MAIGRVVPWVSWEEWSAVHRGLFAADSAQHRAALRQIALWRCRGKVPLAVDVTGCLTEIGIRDQDSRNSEIKTTETLRLEYSMALVRMVNGISDKAQKGKTATSVSSNAAAAGLPRLLVDVRHEASHNEMPSLPLLRLAAAQALDWLQSAYWQRQDEHLQAQHQRVVELLKEFVALRTGSESHPKLDLPSEHAAASPDRYSHAAATSPGSRKQKTSVQAEQLHQQQAVLNQLKELPVKSMNASLLVSPLLDHGTLKLSDAEEDRTSDAVGSDASLHGTISALAAVWPSLPAVLLSGAVQRLCSNTNVQDLSDDQLTLLTAVMKALLQGHNLTDAQQQPSQKKRRGKRKSTGSDTEPANAAGRPVWCASAAQLKGCIADCLESQPTAQSKRAAALHIVLLLLVQQMKEEHAAEYDSWGSSPEQLMSLMPPVSHTELSQKQQHISCKAAVANQNSPALAGSVFEDTFQAQKRQKQMLHNLGAQDELIPKASRGWTKATDWIPCAIGALPSVSDPNGRLSTFEASQSQTAKADTSAAETQPHAPVHANPMAFAVQSAHPSQAHSHSVEAARAFIEGAALDRKRLSLDTVEDNFADYWQRFGTVDNAVVNAPIEARPALMPQGKAVRVL